MSKNISIIGGSAAGLYSALMLAQQGARVRLFEASNQIPPESRTLIVTHRIKALLAEVGVTVPAHQIRRFELFTDGRFATISLQHPDLVIDRAKLIPALAARTSGAGVEVFNGSAFLDLAGDGTQLRFRISRNGDTVEQCADALLGADGAFSTVAQHAGWQALVTAPLVQTIVELPQDQSPDTTRVWFLPQETDYFFWLIPHSATAGVLGLIGREGTHEKDAITTLSRFMAKKGIMSSAEFQRALIPVYEKWESPHRRLNGGQVALAGDAAGHVKVSTVGGIVTGFQGAMGVCEALLNGGHSEKLTRLKRELNHHRRVRTLLNGFTQTEYSRLLDFLSSPTKRALAHITRDECGKLLGNILLREPRFLTLGLRSLLRQALYKRR